MGAGEAVHPFGRFFVFSTEQKTICSKILAGKRFFLMYETLVIGAGQAGLAASYYLKQAGLRFAVLEAGETPTGSWSHYYESLQLFFWRQGIAFSPTI
jgi:NADPH-dependent 2,4-dienoyl-CoA reductase/sulfur reductase-like enzyme